MPKNNTKKRNIRIEICGCSRKFSLFVKGKEMIWCNDDNTKMIGIHLYEQGIFLNWFCSSEEERYGLRLEDVKKYLTNEEYLDLQRTIFDNFV